MADVKQSGGKAETKTTSGEDPASTPSCLPARNVRCGTRRAWEKGTGLLDIALTERETEARCPDLLGGFCWVFCCFCKVLLGQGVPRESSLPGFVLGLAAGFAGTHRDLNKPQQEQGKQFPSSASWSQQELHKVDIA